MLPINQDQVAKSQQFKIPYHLPKDRKLMARVYYSVAYKQSTARDGEPGD